MEIADPSPPSEMTCRRMCRRNGKIAYKPPTHCLHNCEKMKSAYKAPTQCLHIAYILRCRQCVGGKTPTHRLHIRLHVANPSAHVEKLKQPGKNVFLHFFDLIFWSRHLWNIWNGYPQKYFSKSKSGCISAML